MGETQQEVTPAASRSPSGGELEQEEGERGDKEEEEIKQKEVVDSQQEQQHEGEAAVEAEVEEEEDGAEARGGAAGRRASLHHTASPMRVQRNGACSHSTTSDYELSLDLKNKQVGCVGVGGNGVICAGVGERGARLGLYCMSLWSLWSFVEVLSEVKAVCFVC